MFILYFSLAEISNDINGNTKVKMKKKRLLGSELQEDVLNTEMLFLVHAATFPPPFFLIQCVLDLLMTYVVTTVSQPICLKQTYLTENVFF